MPILKMLQEKNSLRVSCRSAGNILALSLMLLALHANCQKLIRGIVVDSLSLNNIPGATVKIKNNTHSAVTDINGIFLISVKPNDTLIFSLMGYRTKETPVEQSNDVMFVRMQEESILLNEVVVEEYRYLEKKIPSPTLSTTKPIKARRGLQPSTEGAGAGMFINWGYFSKEQKDKRKLMATLAELERIKVYVSIISEPNFMDEMMKRYTLTEKKYYEILAVFNQENSWLIRSGRELEIIYALHYYFSHPDAHLTYQIGVKPR